jgi:ABC-type antimicrobial peptide transport system permease subunit
MHARYADVYGDTRLAASVSGGFGLIAVIVAMVGLFAVTTMLVAGRTREIGVRIALGATHRDIRQLVLHRALGYVGCGIAVGTAGALSISRWLSSQLFGVEPTDPVTYAGVAVVLGAIALVATWSPARRATRVDPVTALRSE